MSLEKKIEEDFKKKISKGIKNAVAVWDFTIPKKDFGIEALKKFLGENCKKWCFQIECGESGYIHYQGRVSLIKKTRKPDKPCPSCHWSPTTTDESENLFYVIKSSTRLEGPWSDKDPKPVYIPKQIRQHEELYPYQKKIIEKAAVWDDRVIDLLIDTGGNNGKSFIAGYMRCHNLARVLPPVNDYKDLMQIVMCVPEHTCYLVDMPRAIKKEKMAAFFAALESIKGGYAYDTRYSFKDKYFDSPNIWVFTNKIPKLTYLSKDRWRFWGIDSEKKLFSRDLDDAESLSF